MGKWGLRTSLALHFSFVVALLVLNFRDERLEHVSLSSLLLCQSATGLNEYRILLPVVVYLLTATLAIFAAGMIFAERSHRSLKHLFILMTMMAVTLAMFTNWQKISWEGRRFRMSKRVASLESVCKALQKDWPADDTNHPMLGPIMVYPQWNPSTLILLTPRQIDERFCIAAIDRSNEQVLRFELSSGFETIWLEHRLDAGLDLEFKNGIEQHFVRQHYVSLSPNWYLVRYQ